MTVRGLLAGEDGYDLWLRYVKVSEVRRVEYGKALPQYFVAGPSSVAEAIRAELRHAFGRLFTGNPSDAPRAVDAAEWCTGLVVGTRESCPKIAELASAEVDFDALGPEGFALIHRPGIDEGALLFVAANTDGGALYGTFALLRHLSLGLPLTELTQTSAPKVGLRMLNHWDNLDGTIERGFAGSSLWKWFELPDIVSPRITDYGRALASVGINGAALTNVNSNALVLSASYLEKVRALADVLRSYGVRVYLTARFSAPIELGGLATADPADLAVQTWWKEKCAAIYELVPDFGGFVVKANSEGQPGPQDYGRSHAEGANLLARALAPHGGVVIWRAFVYSAEVPADRATQAYSEFVPLDHAFDANVLVQVKNGPIDFQPREPHHPLFGAMRKTPVMIEFQLTQEYLGNSTHLCYLGPLFSEVLGQETFHPSAAPGGDSRVSRVTDGTMTGAALSGMSAVANIGDDPNWCGHPFAAANWYAYGRLCWDPDLGPETLAREWLGQTFSSDPTFTERALSIMMRSRQAVVDYMTPLGLHHIMAYNHHQGPAPWIDEGRADWTCTYYHRADEQGLGFNRTSTGSNALAQYPEPYRAQMERLESCPLDLVLWYHHVAWDQILGTGNIMWDELCLRYQRGLDEARSMQSDWDSLEPFVDPLRHAEIAARLSRQVADANFWKDACLGYFQTFCGRPYPAAVEPPAMTLAECQTIEHYFVPGIPERRFS